MYWKKLLKQIQIHSLKTKDKKSQKLVIELGAVPAEIQDEALLRWLLACKNIYTIAFFQWRLSKCNERDKCQLEDLIQSSVNFFSSFKKANQDKKVTTSTEKLATLPLNFMIRYGLNEDSSEHFNINSFYQIGLSDPFPEIFADKNVDYFYPEHKILNTDYIPSMTYIPRKDVMLRLMRSCLNVKEK